MNITDLSPAEQSLIYNALLFFKQNAEDAFAECITTSGHPTVNRIFFAHAEKSVKDIINKLFAETFIDELDFVKHFHKNFPEIKALLENQPSKPQATGAAVQA